jgi:SAM-dependent methyltransferase
MSKLSAAQQRQDPRAQRRRQGAFPTPLPIVQFIVREVLRAMTSASIGGDRTIPRRPFRVLEPSCGDGRFLVEMYRHLIAPDASLAMRRRALANLYGVDVDPQAVNEARRALAITAADGDPRVLAEFSRKYQSNIRPGNALIGPDYSATAELNASPMLHGIDWPRDFPNVFAGRRPGFEIVVGNPPYLNIRRLTQAYGEDVKRYFARRFATARGSFDLYVLFLEQAWQLLAPGGVCGMIVPNKLATLDYARSCRRLLLEQTTLVSITDLSHLPIFPGAGVYPYVVVWKKQPPPPQHRVATLIAESPAALEPESPSPRYFNGHWRLPAIWRFTASCPWNPGCQPCVYRAWQTCTAARPASLPPNWRAACARQRRLMELPRMNLS